MPNAIAATPVANTRFLFDVTIVSFQLRVCRACQNNAARSTFLSLWTPNTGEKLNWSGILRLFR
jgi:hypothetical protein